MKFSIPPVLLVLIAFCSKSQIIDSKFHNAIPLKGAVINIVNILPDGKVLLGGDFQFYETTRANNLVKLNADGTLDNSFTSTLPGNFVVYKLAVQSTGDIVVMFGSTQVSTRNVITWVSSSGVVKKRIELPKVFLNDILVQADDKIVIVGSNNGSGFILRYNSDMTEDMGFSKQNFNKIILSAAMQQNKIILSGLFTKVNAVTTNGIARLNSDGTLDTHFTLDDNITAIPTEPIVLSNNTILLRNAYISGEYRSIVRLTPNGPTDYSFVSPSFDAVNSPIKIDHDKMIAIVTNGDAFKEQKSFLVRFLSDGTVDTSIDLPYYVDPETLLFDVNTTSHEIILGNYFLNSVNDFGIVKMSSDGAITDDFKPELSSYGNITALDTLVDKIIVGGNFVRIDGLRTFNIAALTNLGHVDASMKITSRHRPVKDLKVHGSDAIYATSGKDIYKINSIGELQPSFAVTFPKPYYSFDKILLQKDGKLIGVGENVLARLNADGAIDATFNVAANVYPGPVADFGLQSTGRIIFGAQFHAAPFSNLVRLNSDGSIDQAFGIGSGADNSVSGVQVFKNDDILIGGYFKTFNGIPTLYYMAKLSANGTLDTEFNANFNLMYYLPAMVKVFEDKIYVPREAFDSDGSLFEVIQFNAAGQQNNAFPITFESPIIRELNTLEFTHETLYLLGKTFLDQTKDPIFILKVVLNPIVTEVTEENLPTVISFFPNPVQNVCHLKLQDNRDKNSNTTAIVCDETGRVILQEGIRTKEELSLNLETLQPGFYMLYLKIGALSMRPIKIVKQ